MASVKGSNTSKTAHVMNLLSRNRGAEPPPAHRRRGCICFAGRHPWPAGTPYSDIPAK